MHPMLNTAVKAARKAGAIINRASLDLDQLTVRSKQDRDYVTEVDQMAERAIIEVAHERGADLVVIGNDQRTGLARTLAGATTDIVAGGLDCAVLVVKQSKPEKLPGGGRDRG